MFAGSKTSPLVGLLLRPAAVRVRPGLCPSTRPRRVAAASGEENTQQLLETASSLALLPVEELPVADSVSIGTEVLSEPGAPVELLLSLLHAEHVNIAATAGFALGLLYLLVRPGLALGLAELLLLQPLDALLTKRECGEARLSKRLATGNFGSVYAGTLDGMAVIAKKSKDVEGGASSLEIEEHFARRLRRSPLLAAVTAPYIGSFADGTVLVWRDVGQLTLAQALTEPGFSLSMLGQAMGVLSRSGGGDDAQRGNKVARAVMRSLLTSASRLHDVGIVHRDIKPDNFLITDGGTGLLIDFGAAVDLRTGYGYVPGLRQCDPAYVPPEERILPENVPVPPAVVAALFSPLLWAYGAPHLFDSFSAGIVLLQLGLPALRRRNSLGPDGVFRRSLAEADFDLRRWRAGANPSVYDFALLDANGGLAWDLACRLVTRRNPLRSGRLSCAQALLHPWMLFGL